jgi:hypothetical protein
LDSALLAVFMKANFVDTPVVDMAVAHHGLGSGCIGPVSYSTSLICPKEWAAEAAADLSGGIVWINVEICASNATPSRPTYLLHRTTLSM